MTVGPWIRDFEAVVCRTFSDVGVEGWRWKYLVTDPTRRFLGLLNGSPDFFMEDKILHGVPRLSASEIREIGHDVFGFELGSPQAIQFWRQDGGTE